MVITDKPITSMCVVSNFISLEANNNDNIIIIIQMEYFHEI